MLRSKYIFEIGTGGTAIVHLVQNQNSLENFAVKVYDMNEDISEELMNEKLCKI